MKFIALCAAAALSLSLVSCGGYDNEAVKKINDVTDGKYTTEQEETGLKLYIEFQEEEISDLKDQISDAKDIVAKEKANAAAKSIYNATSAEGKETESYKAVKDQITKNNQEIEQLKKDLEKANKEAEKELGYEVKD